MRVQRVSPSLTTKGFKLRTTACDRCDLSVRLMCKDRCHAGRAVLCEIVTEEERQMEYATTQQPGR